jgi:hypothetical protein
MTNAQLWILLAGQFAGNALLVTVLVLYVKADVASVRVKVDALRETMLNGFTEINRRFDDMQSLWLSELRLEQSREG